MLYMTNYSSPLGRVTLASDGSNITGLWFEGQKYYGSALDSETVQNDGLAVFDAAKSWIDRYFAGENPDIGDLPIAPQGSEFRKSVWEILCGIPYGETISYGDIAKKIAAKLGRETMSGQAVGGAVGHNPISVIIPCHRVVGANGSLTGYAGGIERKIKLLELEGVDVSEMPVPISGSAV